jgi:hypothetical protein
MGMDEVRTVDGVVVIAGSDDLDAPESMKIRAEKKDGRLEKVVVSFRKDMDIRIQNHFRTELIAVSDDIKVGRFGDFIQKLHRCRAGDYVKISGRKGVTYTITAII